MIAPAFDRETFLSERLTGIGGSDAAAACGISPYTTKYELYLEKTGELAPADLSDNPRVQWGNRLEPIVADAFAERTGFVVRPATELIRHPVHNHMIAHVDRVIEGRNAILECKTAGAMASRDEWGEEGTDQVPLHYLIQVSHYMAVTEAELAYLAVLIGGSDFRIYTVPRDETVIDELIRQEGEFWECVRSSDPPPMDYTHPDALALVKRRYSGTTGEVIELPDTAVSVHERLVRAKAAQKAAEAAIDAAKAELLDMVGSAAAGRLPDGSGYRRQLVKKQPFTVTPKPYFDFRHIKEITK